jgi:hypothetical protein
VKIISKTIIPLFLVAVMLASCNGSILTPTISPTDVMETAMSTVTATVVETQVAIPTTTSSPQPPTPIPPTPVSPTQTPFFPVSVDRHDPESVLRAYFDAWGRSDWSTQQSLMDELYADMSPEPVDSIRILEIQRVSSSPTECVYSVLFDIQVKGQGVSMHSGQVRWNYYLTWYADRDSWLISNYGYG